jgi:hypothetical protein
MLGFLGNMTSAPCCVTMGSGALLRFLSNATIETGGLSTSSIVTNATMDGRYYGFRISTDITVCCNPLEWRRGLRIARVQTCLCVGREEHVSLYGGWWRHSIVGPGKWQVNDGLYAEVPLWCASGPIARRRIDLVCLEALWLQGWEWV